MNVRHLQAFVTVAEYGTFTQAARRLNIAQPPLSRYVQELEHELGSVLFVRSPDGAALTVTGRLVLERAMAVLKSFDDIQEFARSSDFTRSVLRVGIGCGLWGALERIRTLHATRFHASRITAEDLCPAQHSTDSHPSDAFITRDRPAGPVFESEVLFEERFVALIRERHPLASRESITLAELASEPLLLFERQFEPGMWDRTSELIRMADVKPRVVNGQPPPCTIAARVSVASGEGYYLSTASAFTQTHRASGVAAVALREPYATVPVRLAWRADAPRHVRELLRSARTAFSQGTEPGLTE